MLNFHSTRPVDEVAMVTTMPTDYGEVHARYFQGIGGRYWLASVTYRLQGSIEIYRPSPPVVTDADAIAWIEAAIEEGPQFLLPLLEAAT